MSFSGGFFYDSKIKNKLKQSHDLSIFSFHPVKHIACGEGGMITTNNIELRDKLINLRTHGINKTLNFLNLMMPMVL